ncbi:hypothetical protein [Autumnicola edwardsiae]|uniref:Uncharacterized protein n=1 Tax=Autumnicola edwardsiae TaxID=3075594 RepID=A0ABU3CWS8_9FLAO|nr:hypothetical protein [Zunongwangia sp. F297]MDT0650726.1 hypothetical protein [Zunongwangia sp. F297]
MRSFYGYITNAIKYLPENKNIDVIINETREDMVGATVRDRGD